MTTIKRFIVMIVTALLVWGCSSDESYTKYSRYKASFTYFYVQTAIPLKDALYSPGVFCTIRLTLNKQIVFKTLTQEQPVDVTAPNYYQNFTCLSGFIVGYSNMIELGQDELSQVCYDLACPNCYRDDAIKRDLALREGGFAYCSRCKRSYSLNNMGLINEGDAGRPLERYHISLRGENQMTIYN